MTESQADTLALILFVVLMACFIYWYVRDRMRKARAHRTGEAMVDALMRHEEHGQLLYQTWDSSSWDLRPEDRLAIPDYSLRPPRRA